MIITIDFETYSEAGFVYDEKTKKWGGLLNSSKKGLPGIGVAGYAKHPSTEILCLAYSIDAGPVKVWKPGEALPHDLYAYLNIETVLIEAWNVSFERWVWNCVGVIKYNFPRVSDNRWRCAAAKSRAFSLPGSLSDAAKVMKTEAQKDKNGKRLLTKFSMPRNPTIKDPRVRIRPCDDVEEAELLYKYCIDDVKTELALSAIIPALSETELAFWSCDQAINFRGVQIDLASVFSCIHIIEQANAKYSAELPTLTGGAVTRSSEIAKIRTWMQSLGVWTDSLDEEHITQLLKDPLLLPQIRRVLEIRKLTGSAAVKKLYAMLTQCTPDGRVHDLFIYHSARTGRAAGRSVQPQNLPRGEEGFDVDEALSVIGTGVLEDVETRYGNATAAVSNCLRGMFIAKPNHTLISSDYSAIEAVVLAELAGEDWRKEVFRTHGKIYEMSASKITGMSFDDILAHKDKTGKHHEVRKLGKVAELASGYSGWIGAWLAFGADEFLSEDEIKKAILAWRAASPAIVEFWGGQQRNFKNCFYGVEGAAIQAVLYAGRSFSVRDISYIVQDDVLYCVLPSGRKLSYHKPRLEASTRRPGTQELSFEGWNTNVAYSAAGWVRQSTYGGKLVENITQAVARDILAYAIIQLEQAGYDVVLHVHDEIVSEVPEGAGKTLEEFERVMSTMPAWAQDWPVVARGGWVGKRYRK